LWLSGWPDTAGGMMVESFGVGLVGGGGRSPLDMQAAMDDSWFLSSQDRSDTCRFPSAMSSLSGVVEVGEQARRRHDRCSKVGMTW